jgi:hypothetical protein
MKKYGLRERRAVSQVQYWRKSKSPGRLMLPQKLLINYRFRRVLLALWLQRLQ